MTLIIIIITALVSILAFRDRLLFNRLALSPYQIVHRREWYRVITHGFIHGDYLHLAINMLVFYSFGRAVESYIGMYSVYVNPHFFLLYFGGMIVATITTIIKYKNNYSYMAVGASGAVAAVLFASIFFNPWKMLYFMGVIPIPGIVFGVLYLWYSSRMSRKSADNINHDAHFYGAIFGLLYPLVINPKLIFDFVQMLLHPTF